MDVYARTADLPESEAFGSRRGQGEQLFRSVAAATIADTVARRELEPSDFSALHPTLQELERMLLAKSNVMSAACHFASLPPPKSRDHDELITDN